MKQMLKLFIKREDLATPQQNEKTSLDFLQFF